MLYKKINSPEYKKVPSYVPFCLIVFGIPIAVTAWMTIKELDFFIILIICVPLTFVLRRIALDTLPCCTAQSYNYQIFKEYHQFPDRIYLGRPMKSSYSVFPNVELAIWIRGDELHFCSNHQKEDFGEIIIPFKNIDFFSKDEIYKITQLTLKDEKETKELSFDYSTYISFNTLIPQFKRSRALRRANSNNASNTVMFNFEAEKKEKGSKCAYCGTYIPYEQTTCSACGAVNPIFDRINDDDIEKLKKIKELLDSKAITQEEYDRMKKQIIN